MPENQDIRWRLCLHAARSGSAEALGQLLAGAERYLIHVAANQMRRELFVKESASDLVQSTFLEATRGLQNFRGETESHFRQWLKQILVNNIRDVASSYRTKKRCLDREISLEECNSVPLIDGHEAPGASIERSEQLAALQRAMELLSFDLLEVVRLRFEDNKSFMEIGQILDITEMAAQKRWHRAITQLRGSCN